MPTTITAKRNLHKAIPPSMQQTTAIRHTLLVPQLALKKNAKLALLAGKTNVKLISSGVQAAIIYFK